MYGIEIGSEELQADYPVKNVIVRNNLVYKNSCGGIRVGGYDKKKPAMWQKQRYIIIPL